ncbi:MAG: hypothetical protein PF443_14640, partial [Allgaiera sp.]|jgi:hypothetical protein|nr:hypothetical protein [Allgaiera sp.]
LEGSILLQRKEYLAMTAANERSSFQFPSTAHFTAAGKILFFKAPSRPEGLQDSRGIAIFL